MNEEENNTQQVQNPGDRAAAYRTISSLGDIFASVIQSGIIEVYIMNIRIEDRIVPRFFQVMRFTEDSAHEMLIFNDVTDFKVAEKLHSEKKQNSIMK